MELTDATTAELIEELLKREGVSVGKVKYYYIKSYYRTIVNRIKGIK